MGTVFISYRRESAAGDARSLFMELVARLGKPSVFMDVDSMSVGRDFRKQLQDVLAGCDFVFVVIDKVWADAKDAAGTVRLTKPNDFVRLEVETALKNDIAVVPLLVGGAQMPDPERLPPELRDLPFRQAFELTHAKWESDVQEMIRRCGLERSALEVPKRVTDRLLPEKQGPIEFVRLHQAGAQLKQEGGPRGDGAYYSFVRRTHEYGHGSDIKLEQGGFRTGFAGADYGYFMYVGPGTIAELVACEIGSPPKTLGAERLDAWRYLYEYQPPADIKLIRREQKNAGDGLAIGKAKLSERAAVSLGGLYLLRSINIRDSDILVGFVVTDRLVDNSVVLAWRILKTFDTPISTGRDD